MTSHPSSRFFVAHPEGHHIHIDAARGWKPEKWLPENCTGLCQGAQSQKANDNAMSYICIIVHVHIYIYIYICIHTIYKRITCFFLYHPQCCMIPCSQLESFHPIETQPLIWMTPFDWHQIDTYRLLGIIIFPYGTEKDRTTMLIQKKALR